MRNSKKTVLYFLIIFTFSNACISQTYSPITVTGFNVDAVAETAPNALATTSQALDAFSTSNTVFYSAAFATTMGFGGGLPNTGVVVTGAKTYQLMPYTGNNAFYVQTATSKTISLTSPSNYSNLSFLVFSTEGTSNMSITVKYTDLSTTSFGSFLISDWFGGSSIAKCCLGRCNRISSVVSSGGLPSNPNLYYLDINLSCTDQSKNVASIVVNGISGTIGAYVMAVSGVPAIAPITVLNYGGSSFCTSATITTPTLTGASTGTFSASPSGLNINSSSGLINFSLSAVGTYSINFTPSSACSSATSFSLSITPSPTLSINSSAAPISTTICAGQSTTLFASGATTYSWNTGEATSSITVSPTSSTVYTITGTSLGCPAYNTANITVTPLPIISVNSATICSGQTITVIASGATTYSWNTGETSNSLIASPTASTIYSVTGTALGCSSINTATIIVNPSPTISVNSTSICAGQTATLIASGALSYTWDTGITTNYLVASPTSSTIYTVTGTSFGCSVSNSATVTVNPTPTITVNSTTICAGQTATIIASGASSYLWSTGSTNNSLIVSPTSTTNYTVTGTLLGCVSSTFLSITTSTIADVNISSTSTVIPCSTNSLILTASSVSGGPYSYQWLLPSGTGNTYGVSNAGTYTVIATNSTNGCTATATQNVSHETIDVSFIADVYEGLAPLIVNFTNTSINTGAVTYLWDFGNSSSSFSTTTTTYITQGTYMVVLTATNGFCVDSAVKYINVEVPSVLTIPNVITPNGDGNNDVFYLNTFNIGQISMSVFDRWGLLMFENTDTGKMSWDGKNKSGNIVNDGIYFYTIKATGLDKAHYERKGTISVFK